MSEQVETSLPNNLDVVRARIFYLASDVETVSPPAAMLLRAVADAIEDGDSGPISAVKLNGASALRSADLRIRPLDSREQDAEEDAESEVEHRRSQAAQKR